MKVLMYTNAADNNRALIAGNVYDLPDAEAKQIIDGHFGREYTGSKRTSGAIRPPADQQELNAAQQEVLEERKLETEAARKRMQSAGEPSKTPPATVPVRAPESKK